MGMLAGCRVGAGDAGEYVDQPRKLRWMDLRKRMGTEMRIKPEWQCVFTGGFLRHELGVCELRAHASVGDV